MGFPKTLFPNFRPMVSLFNTFYFLIHFNFIGFKSLYFYCIGSIIMAIYPQIKTNNFFYIGRIDYHSCLSCVHV